MGLTDEEIIAFLRRAVAAADEWFAQNNGINAMNPHAPDLDDIREYLSGFKDGYGQEN